MEKIRIHEAEGIEPLQKKAKNNLDGLLEEAAQQLVLTEEQDAILQEDDAYGELKTYVAKCIMKGNHELLARLLQNDRRENLANEKVTFSLTNLNTSRGIFTGSAVELEKEVDMLHFAILMDQPECALAALKAGARQEHSDFFDMYEVVAAKIQSCTEGDPYYRLIQQLIEPEEILAPSVEIVQTWESRLQNSLLLTSAFRGSIVGVKHCLEAGVSVHCRFDGTNDTPLHFAARHNYPVLLKELVEAGADITALNVNEETPEDVYLAILYKNLTKYLIPCACHYNRSSEVKACLEQLNPQPTPHVRIQLTDGVAQLPQFYSVSSLLKHFVKKFPEGTVEIPCDMATWQVVSANFWLVYFIEHIFGAINLGLETASDEDKDMGHNIVAECKNYSLFTAPRSKLEAIARCIKAADFLNCSLLVDIFSLYYREKLTEKMINYGAKAIERDIPQGVRQNFVDEFRSIIEEGDYTQEFGEMLLEEIRLS